MTRWLSVSAVLLGSVAALAQQPGLPQPAAPVPAQAPLLDPVNNKVDAILVNWEKAMNGLNTLHTAVNRTAVDKVFLAKEVFAGEAKYVRPNKASLLLFNQDPKKKSEFEKLVCNGTVAYKWEPLKNEIHVYELPKAKPGQVSDDNFVSML